MKLKIVYGICFGFSLLLSGVKAQEAVTKEPRSAADIEKDLAELEAKLAKQESELLAKQKEIEKKQAAINAAAAEAETNRVHLAELVQKTNSVHQILSQTILLQAAAVAEKAALVGSNAQASASVKMTRVTSPIFTNAPPTKILIP